MQSFKGCWCSKLVTTNRQGVHNGCQALHSLKVPGPRVNSDIDFETTTPASHTLPASFIYTSQPAFWTVVSGTQAPWPATGPDVTGGAAPGGFGYIPPAENCYANILSGPVNGTGSALAFDASTCYASYSVSLSPSSLAFGNQAVGTTSAGQVLTLTNVGGVTLNISGIALTGANHTEFGASTTCTSTLAAGANCTITITFMPAAAGVRIANVVVTDDAGGVLGSTQTSTLSGTGTTTSCELIEPQWR